MKEKDVISFESFEGTIKAERYFFIVIISFNFLSHETVASARRHVDDVMDSIFDIREYDVPYHMRVSLDLKINVGKWYTVLATPHEVRIEERPDRLIRPDTTVLAWDIETTKLPLKFPNREIDQVLLVCLMSIHPLDHDDFLYGGWPGFSYYQ